MFSQKSLFRVSAVLVKDGRVLVIHRRKNGKEYFILVGGTPEKGETHEQTLIRETKEEASLDVRLVQKLSEVFNNFDNRTHLLYLAEITGGKLKLGGGELERNSEDNQYFLEWRTVAELETGLFFPDGALKVIKEYLRKCLQGY